MRSEREGTEVKRAFAMMLCLACLLCAARAEEDRVANWYEVFVRAYQDSDGDGLGDLNGLRQRLDYIVDMGWRGLWLMPVMPSPSYHKYDVTDYMDIDPQYGTLEDMRELIDAAVKTGRAAGHYKPGKQNKCCGKQNYAGFLPIVPTVFIKLRHFPLLIKLLHKPRNSAAREFVASRNQNENPPELICITAS